MSWANPFIDEPAAVSSNIVSATCEAISMLWALPGEYSQPLDERQTA